MTDLVVKWLLAVSLGLLALLVLKAVLMAVIAIQDRRKR